MKRPAAWYASSDDDAKPLQQATPKALADEKDTSDKKGLDKKNAKGDDKKGNDMKTGDKKGSDKKDTDKKGRDKKDTEMKDTDKKEADKKKPTKQSSKEEEDKDSGESPGNDTEVTDLAPATRQQRQALRVFGLQHTVDVAAIVVVIVTIAMASGRTRRFDFHWYSQRGFSVMRCPWQFLSQAPMLAH